MGETGITGVNKAVKNVKKGPYKSVSVVFSDSVLASEAARLAAKAKRYAEAVAVAETLALQGSKKSIKALLEAEAAFDALTQVVIEELEGGVVLDS